MWTEAQRALLDGILDEIIPPSANGRIPGAGALGVADHLLAVADRDPEVRALFEQGLAGAGRGFAGLDGDARRDMLKRLETEEKTFFRALIRHTYMGYYSRSDVRALFGLSPEPTQPRGYDVPPDDAEEMAELLASVRAREPCYRAG